MRQCLGGFEAAIGIPAETAGNEVDKRLVIGFERLGESFAAGAAAATFAANRDAGLADGVKEEFLARTAVDEVAVRGAEELHDTGELFLFVFAGKQRVAGPELGKDTAEGPHVDTQAIGRAKNNFWGAVKAGLDVSVNLFLLAAAAAKVDNADVCVTGVAEEDVFWLEVAVDNAFLVEQGEADKELAGEAANEGEGEAGEVVGANELVQVDAEAGRYDAQVVAEIEGAGDAKRSVRAIGVLEHHTCQHSIPRRREQERKLNIPTPPTSAEFPPPPMPADETFSCFE